MACKSCVPCGLCGNTKSIRIIIDPRVPTEIIEGETTTFGFGTKEVLEGSWKPMKIPKTEDIEEIISIMESSDFGINKEYIEPQRKR